MVLVERVMQRQEHTAGSGIGWVLLVGSNHMPLDRCV